MNPKTGEVATYDPHSRPKVPVSDDRTQAQIAEDRKEASKKTPQFLAREEMAKRTQAARDAESSAFKPDVLAEDGSITPAAESTEPASEPIDATTPPEPALETAPVPQEEETRELIVNGQRIKVPLSKVIEEGQKALQKESAADMKLAAASELERQWRERNEQLPKGAAETPAEQPKPSHRDAKTLAKAIQFGTEEEAETAVNELISSKGGISKEDAIAIARAELRTEREQMIARKPFEDANNWVRSEYKHIFSDPDMEQLFMAKEARARKEGNKDPYLDLYKNIAQEIETKFQLQKAEATATAPVAQDRITRKANAPRSIAGASTRGESTPAPKQPTVQDYVQRQRELRGQVPLTKHQGI